MKRILFVLILVLFASTVSADLMLDTPVVRPDIDRFRIEKFSIDTGVYPIVTIEAEFGYQVAFSKILNERIVITNGDILRNNRTVYRDDADGNMMELPAAYRANPASTIIVHINNGTFGGQSNMKDYLETVVKTILGL